MKLNFSKLAKSVLSRHVWSHSDTKYTLIWLRHIQGDDPRISK